jgi:hypothetical protein
MIGMLIGFGLTILLPFIGLTYKWCTLPINLPNYRIVNKDMTFLVSSIEIIQNPTGSIKRAYDLIKSAEYELEY